MAHSIEATLQDTEQFNFFKQFLLALSGLYFIDKLDSRILVHPVYFVYVGADTIVLLRPHFHHLQNVLALLGTFVGQLLEDHLVTRPLSKTLLH